MTAPECPAPLPPCSAMRAAIEIGVPRVIAETLAVSRTSPSSADTVGAIFRGAGFARGSAISAGHAFHFQGARRGFRPVVAGSRRGEANRGRCALRQCSRRSRTSACRRRRGARRIVSSRKACLAHARDMRDNSRAACQAPYCVLAQRAECKTTRAPNAASTSLSLAAQWQYDQRGQYCRSRSSTCAIPCPTARRCLSAPLRAAIGRTFRRR